MTDRIHLSPPHFIDSERMSWNRDPALLAD
jgi:hypothetical protein